MACVLADEDLLQNLTSGGVISDELFNQDLLLFTTCITQKQIMIVLINKGNTTYGLKRMCSAKPFTICDTLVSFAQFKKREKYQWRSATFTSNVAGFSDLLKVILLHGCFSFFLNFTNGAKFRRASHILR